MNEISRCCRTLGVRHGATIEEVKAAYRDLVQVWHPDRFAGNERLQAAAQEKLKEINLAWEYLSAHAFENGILVEPDETVFSPPSEVSLSGLAFHRTIWPWLLALAILAAATVLILIARGRRPPVPKQTAAKPAIPERDAAPVPPAVNNSPTKTSPAPRVFPFVTDVLNGHARTNAATGWLEFPPLLEPPFAVHCEATLNDLSEFHLHYAMGQVMFNWADHLKDLFLVSPQGAMNTIVPGEGILLPGSRRAILWIVQTNRMTVEVDGKTRFQTNDNFSGLKGRVSAQNFSGPINLTAFEVQTPQDPHESQTAPLERKGFSDDILPSMIPGKNLTEHYGPEGVVLQTSVDWDSRLMSSQSFRPPFTIRTRAKTDAFNLRLFCENGMIIFNWELNSRELRAHDPLNGAAMPLANQGFLLPNQWHDISWSIQPMGMTLIVDGKTRFQNHRDYRAVNGKVGIAPYKSELTVDYFVVDKKATGS